MPQLTGGEIVAEFLVKAGMPYFIGIPGHGCLGLVDAFKDRQDKIKILQVKQEMAAVHLAEGYYRASGQPLAVFTSIGPGAINTAIGAANAYVDSMPVMIFTGDTHTHMFGRGVLQEIERTHSANFPRVLEPIVKRYWQVTDVAQLPHILHRAYNQMMTGRRGPVLIDLPMDVQCDAIDIDVPEPAGRQPKGRPFGDPAEIDKALKLIKRAKRPVILAGGGAVAAEAWGELKDLAEHVGAAVVTTMMGKSVFPENHPLYAWHAGSKGTTCGNRLCAAADVLIAVGCRFADETTSSYKHGVSFAIPPTKLIHIDISPDEIGKNYPVEVGIVGDAKMVLNSIVKKLRADTKPRRYVSTLYFSEIQKLKKEWLKSLSDFVDDSKEPVMISAALREIRKALKHDAYVVTSSGNVQAQVLQEFAFYEPKTCITTGGFSTMGFSLPAAIGVKLAQPDRQVVALIGDGDFMMAMQELSTAVQLDVPIVVVIINNMGWLAIKDLQMAAYGADREMACDFLDKEGKPYSPDFEAIAKAFGCHAEKVSKAKEVRTVLRHALAADGPAVVEIVVNRKFPHSGSPAVGWWDVPVPTYLTKPRQKYERERQEEQLS